MDDFFSSLSIAGNHIDSVCSFSLIRTRERSASLRLSARYRIDRTNLIYIYGISSFKHNLKGILINGYGASSDQFTDDLVRALRERQ